MNTSVSSDENDSRKIIDRLNKLESRISKIEAHLRYMAHRESYEREEMEEEREQIIKSPEQASLESSMVEYGLTWLSTIVFLFGIVFLMLYIRNSGHPLLATFTGYMAAATLFTFTYLFRKSLVQNVMFLNASGMLLVYFVTLKLHFLSAEPLLQSTGLTLLLVSLTIMAMIWYAIKRKSELLAFLSLLVIVITGIIADDTMVTLSCFALASGLSLFYFMRHYWWRQLATTALMVYIAHMMWIFGNPFMGHTMKAVEAHQNNIVFLFLYGFIFSSTMIIANKEKISDYALGTISIINAIAFSMLIALDSLIFYKESYVWIFALITVSCLLYAVVLKKSVSTLFAPALYACFGFMALSICIYGFAGLPDSYYWLALQSLIVVSMALWFRSRIIVVVNTLLYIMILLIYMVNSESIDTINFVFALVALATARILNWKKDRLALKTEIYRNIYLIIGFIMVLFAFSEAVPTQYVALSWTGIAILYLVSSILLKNIKYRWMSFLTILCTGGHILFVDLANLDMGYKVITFLLFAAITIGLTLYYTRWIKKKTS